MNIDDPEIKPEHREEFIELYKKRANFQENEANSKERQMQLEEEYRLAKVEIAEKYGYFDELDNVDEY